MANPFEATNASYIGTGGMRSAGLDPWGGMRSAGQNPFAQAVQQPSGGGGMQYNPLTDPAGPLARSGWIGAMLAQGPTREEYQAQQIGQGQQAAVVGIQQRIQAGMTPQRALADFAQSPEGIQFFTSGNGFSDLANVVKGLSPATVEPIKVGANESLVMPQSDGSYASVYTAPNADVNKFTGMSELAGLSAQERADMAKAQMASDLTGDMTASEAAINRLVAQGRITQQTADLMTSGMMKIQDIKDPSGSTIGFGIVDLSNGTITQLPTAGGGEMPQPGDANYVEGVTPGSKPEEQPDNGPRFQGMKNPADIVDAAGPVGWFMDKLGAIGGNISPAMNADQTSKSRMMLGRIMADANQLASTGRVLAQEMKDIRDLSNTTEFWTNPLRATDTLISLHDAYDNAMTALQQQANDPTGKNRGDALTEMAAIRRAKANLPTRESLTAKREALAAMEPYEQLGNQIGEGEQMLEQGGVVDPGTFTGTSPDDTTPSGGQQAEQPVTYKDNAALQKDWQAGKLRKGQTVILNGRPFTVNTDYKTK